MSANAAMPLVLIPGLMCTGDLYADQVAQFASDRPVMVANHRRHATMQAIASDILARAPATFALAGLSMGGYIAFEILRQAPERVERLALLDTNARADRAEQVRLREIGIGLAQAVGVRAAQAYMIPQLIHKDRLHDRLLIARLMKMADATGLAAFERQQRAIMSRPDNRPFLGKINCPTLVIVGEQDRLTPVKVAQEMVDGIAGARLEVIANCGHLSTMEQPRAVNAAMRDWLVG